MVNEILSVIAPRPGDIAIDCTLGHGGHALEILKRIQPTGKFLGLDADPIEFAKTVNRISDLGFDSNSTALVRTNFASLAKTHLDPHRRSRRVLDAIG
jgi:16S rRNA (cytosine1402-N4)-methyltransferase